MMRVLGCDDLRSEVYCRFVVDLNEMIIHEG